MASSLPLNVKYLFWLVPVIFIDGYSAVSFDFGVFMSGDELRSFYSTLFSRIEGLLLVWLFAAFFLSMWWLLFP